MELAELDAVHGVQVPLADHGSHVRDLRSNSVERMANLLLTLAAGVHQQEPREL